MTRGKSDVLIKRISLSVSVEDHRRFMELCKADGRNARQQVMHMTDQRRIEIGLDKSKA